MRSLKLAACRFRDRRASRASSAASSQPSTGAGWIDRFISTTSLSLSTVPEFVSGDRPHRRFRHRFKLLPVTATAPPGSPFFTQLKYLILPAIPLVFILFGYIARMARAGTVEALDSDYVRTATLKGLPRWVVISRHVLRNSLLPDDHRHRHPDRLSDRRPRRGREALQLPGHRQH